MPAGSHLSTLCLCAALFASNPLRIRCLCTAHSAARRPRPCPSTTTADEESQELTSGDDSGGGSGEDTRDSAMGSDSDSEALSTDVSDRARERAEQPLIWDADYSTDVSDNHRRKGRRVVKSALDVAQRHGSDPIPAVEDNL